MRFARRLPLGLVLALSFVPALVAAAPSPKEKAEARTLAADAKKAVKEKRLDDAEKALRRADELDPSQQTKLDLGQLLVDEGQLVEGTRLLHAAADAPGGAKRLADAAKKTLGDAEPKIPWLTVSVAGADAAKTTVSIDGDEVDAKGGIPLDPGAHLVEASSAGFATAKQKVTLASGAHDTLTLTLTQASARDGGRAGDRSGMDLKLPAYVALGVGGAGLVLGTVFGVMAIGQANTAKSKCVLNVCPAAVQSDIDSSKTSGTVSTVSFVIGGVGVAAGVTMLVLPLFTGKKTGALPVTPIVGLDRIGVAGAF